MHPNCIFFTGAEMTGLGTAHTLAGLTRERELVRNSHMKPTPKFTRLSGCSCELLGV